MPFKQTPELYEIQFDVLGESLTNNPYLPPSPIPSKNKVLNTGKDFITGAINELLLEIITINNVVDDSLSQQQAVLGDFIANPSLAADLKKIDTSILRALVKIYQEMSGDLNSPTDISGISPSVKGAILKLNEELVKEKRYIGYRNEYSTTGTEPTHSFLLTYVPIENSIRLFVNGVEYGYDYNTDSRVLYWIFNKDNGGFDLTEGFKVKIVYDFLYEKNM